MSNRINIGKLSVAKLLVRNIFLAYEGIIHHKMRNKEFLYTNINTVKTIFNYNEIFDLSSIKVILEQSGLIKSDVTHTDWFVSFIKFRETK